MKTLTRLGARQLAVLALACAVSCKRDASRSAGSGEPPAADAAAAAEGPLPSLRLGTREPERMAAVEGTYAAHHTDAAQWLELTVDPPPNWQPERVHLELANAFAVLEGPRILVRLPAGEPPALAPFHGEILVSKRARGGRAWAVVPFSVTGEPSKKDRGLPARWVEAASTRFRDGHDHAHPWLTFAAGRVRSISGGALGSGARAVRDAPRRPSTELAQLMYTTTAATSMQEALQVDRGLGVRADAAAPSIPIAKLAPPKLEEHPFERMRAALPDPLAGVPEPLAAATPAEFWYVRFDDIRVMLRVLDEADAWLTPAAHIMEGRAEVRDLSERYQRQLGLRRSGLAKTLGHTVVDRVAAVGSDAYLREGSDITLIFEVSSQRVFDHELAQHMNHYRKEVPGVNASSVVYRQHTIAVMSDPERRVHQHRASVGKLNIVSTSEHACKAVLDAIDGERRRLGDEPDLAYMLARDPGVHQGFGFFGDRFIAEVVGPRQKVLSARRQQALAELLTPGYAAILYGWLEGEAPVDTATLLASGLLANAELDHQDGSPIAFTPASGARSAWGRPDALTPLIACRPHSSSPRASGGPTSSLPRGMKAIGSATSIRSLSASISRAQPKNAQSATLEVRVLPLIAGSDYGDIEDVVGEQRIEAPSIADGVQFVWAVGAESELREALDRGARAMTGDSKIGIGWLGDWVLAGSLDRPPLLDFVALVDDQVQLPPQEAKSDTLELEMVKAIGKLPVYVAAHVRNPAALSRRWVRCGRWSTALRRGRSSGVRSAATRTIPS